MTLKQTEHKYIVLYNHTRGDKEVVGKERFWEDGVERFLDDEGES